MSTTLEGKHFAQRDEIVLRDFPLAWIHSSQEAGLRRCAWATQPCRAT